ncbi:19720_t:CDS:2 [Dentiscutata erythropus]|uniref:19720_t:CDS:1 n=1 Tax=Dentiscutata erythropus TaxID=1348616 RepID=A0A9N8VKH0_9GLOM|nr:19720_t:CDS:2 [Dentiscutata erythropus]
MLDISVQNALKNIKIWLTYTMASLCKKPKLISSLQAILCTVYITSHIWKHETRLEKELNPESQPNLFGQSVFTSNWDENFDRIINQLIFRYNKNFGIEEMNTEILSIVEPGSYERRHEARREVTIKAVLKGECSSYLYEYLKLRSEQASFTKKAQFEHSAYYINLKMIANEFNAKSALDVFELGLSPSKGICGCPYDKLRFGLCPSRVSAARAFAVVLVMICDSGNNQLGLSPSKGICGCPYDKLRKKSSEVTNFWKVKKLEEEESAVHSASLGYLGMFRKSLSQYANSQEAIILSTGHCTGKEREL